MKKQNLIMIGLATLLASATQAYSQEQLAKSIQDARAETARTSLQLKATLGALNGLTQKTEGDLRPAYNTFAAEVTNTEAAAETTAARVKWMDGEGQDYFKEWQNTITTIANKSLRKKSQKRLESVRSDFDEVKKELKEAGVKFKPFLSDLSDIQKTLASDVTAAGVKSVRSTVKSANWNYQSVDREINSAIKELEKMAKSLSPEAK
jgi:predicted  nucleic acid-binding Zn-ribbon protein